MLKCYTEFYKLSRSSLKSTASSFRVSNIMVGKCQDLFHCYKEKRNKNNNPHASYKSLRQEFFFNISPRNPEGKKRNVLTKSTKSLSTSNFKDKATVNLPLMNSSGSSHLKEKKEKVNFLNLKYTNPNSNREAHKFRTKSEVDIDRLLAEQRKKNHKYQRKIKFFPEKYPDFKLIPKSNSSKIALSEGNILFRKEEPIKSPPFKQAKKDLLEEIVKKILKKIEIYTSKNKFVEEVFVHNLIDSELNERFYNLPIELKDKVKGNVIKRLVPKKIKSKNGRSRYVLFLNERKSEDWYGEESHKRKVIRENETDIGEDPGYYKEDYSLNSEGMRETNHFESIKLYQKFQFSPIKNEPKKRLSHVIHRNNNLCLDSSYKAKLNRNIYEILEKNNVRMNPKELAKLLKFMILGDKEEKKELTNKIQKKLPVQIVREIEKEVEKMERKNRLFIKMKTIKAIENNLFKKNKLMKKLESDNEFWDTENTEVNKYERTNTKDKSRKPIDIKIDQHIVLNNTVFSPVIKSNEIKKKDTRNTFTQTKDEKETETENKESFANQDLKEVTEKIKEEPSQKDAFSKENEDFLNLLIQKVSAKNEAKNKEKLQFSPVKRVIKKKNTVSILNNELQSLNKLKEAKFGLTITSEENSEKNKKNAIFSPKKSRAPIKIKTQRRELLSTKLVTGSKIRGIPKLSSIKQEKKEKGLKTTRKSLVKKEIKKEETEDEYYSESNNSDDYEEEEKDAVAINISNENSKKPEIVKTEEKEPKKFDYFQSREDKLRKSKFVAPYRVDRKQIKGLLNAIDTEEAKQNEITRQRIRLRSFHTIKSEENTERSEGGRTRRAVQSMHLKNLKEKKFSIYDKEELKKKFNAKTVMFTLGQDVLFLLKKDNLTEDEKKRYLDFKEKLDSLRFTKDNADFYAIYNNLKLELDHLQRDNELEKRLNMFIEKLSDFRLKEKNVRNLLESKIQWEDDKF